MHMKLTKAINGGQWDALFDELDGDKSGALSHSEFWAKAAIKNSSILSDALNKFDVSTAAIWLTVRCKQTHDFLAQVLSKTLLC